MNVESPSLGKKRNCFAPGAVAEKGKLMATIGCGFDRNTRGEFGLDTLAVYN